MQSPQQPPQQSSQQPAPNDPNNLSGRVMGGYRLERELGRGATGSVWLGRRVDNLAELAAIKILLPPQHAPADERAEFRERFLREANLLFQARHPHILPIYAFGEDPATGSAYMVLPYLTGGTLSTRLNHQPLPLDLAANYVAEIADALDFAHARGIVHRDVKPANLLLDGNGQLLLADFGIARLYDTSGAGPTITGTVLGTAAYMAPEQALGQPVGPAADIYSLGILLYQMVTGRVPFDGPTPATPSTPTAVMLQHIQQPPPPPRGLRPDLPPPAEAVILRALAKRPEERFQSAGELARAFAAGLQGIWPQAPQPQMQMAPTPGTEATLNDYMPPRTMMASAPSSPNTAPPPYAPGYGAGYAPGYAPGYGPAYGPGYGTGYGARRTRRGALFIPLGSAVAVALVLAFLVVGNAAGIRTALLGLGGSSTPAATTNSGQQGSGGSGGSSTPAHIASHITPSTLYAIGDNGTLNALDSATGAVQWSVVVGGAPSGSLPGSYLDATSQGILFVTAAQPDPSFPDMPGVGHLNAIDLQTHAILWTTHRTVIYLGAQAGVVYVSDATGIAALNARTDQRFWHYDEPQAYPLGFGLESNGVGYLSYSQDATHAFVDAIRLSDGKRLWHSALQGLALDALAVADGVAYATSRGSGFALTVTAFSGITGQPLWAAHTQGASIDIQAGSGLVFVHIQGSDVSGNLLVLNAQTGQQSRGFGSHSQPGACVFASPLVTASAVYVACSAPGNSVYAYASTSGSLLWQRRVTGPYISVGGASGAILFAVSQQNGSDSATTTALAASGGSTLWQHPGSYVSATGGVAFVTAGGTLYAFDAATGKALWQNGVLGANIQALAQ